MDSQQYFDELVRRAEKRTDVLKTAEQATLLLLATVCFLIYYLLDKMQEALSILGR